MSQSKYTGGGLVIYILCIKTHRQIHRLAHVYIIFTKDSDNTNPVVSTHGHNSIQFGVILLQSTKEKDKNQPQIHKEFLPS